MIDTMNHLYSRDDFDLADQLKHDIEQGIRTRGLVLSHGCRVDQVKLGFDSSGAWVEDVIVPHGYIMNDLILYDGDLGIVRFDYIVFQMPSVDFSNRMIDVRFWFRDMDSEHVWWNAPVTTLGSSFKTVREVRKRS